LSLALDEQEASFHAMWSCINEIQRMSLLSSLTYLTRRDRDRQERNEALNFIGTVLHSGNQTELNTTTFGTFTTVLRDLTAPGMMAMLTLAQQGCLMMDESVATPSDATMHTVDIPSPDSRSRDSGAAEKDSAGVSSNSLIFFGMELVLDGVGSAVGSFGTLSDCNANVDCAGPPSGLE
jgi:hypothetical protein